MMEPKKFSTKTNRLILGILYVFAGTMHFVKPGFYLAVMPHFLPDHMVLINFSGVTEIIAGLLVIFGNVLWRSIGAIAIVVMLFFFILVHVDFIIRTDCSASGICWRGVFGWVRLVVVHPVLIYWAWTVGRDYFRVSRNY